MFGSAVLDVAIGIVLLFLFVSLICSALREAIEALLKSRALDLRRGIREILHDKDGDQLTEQIYNHPFVYSLYAGSYKTPPADRPVPPEEGLKATLRSTWATWSAQRNLPAYIPARSFSAALIDIIRQTDGNEPLSAESFRLSCERIENEPLRRAVLAALDEAGNDLLKARRNIENWYDATMDRVSGWYKRRTQGILLAIGLLAAIGFNIDSVNVARHLAIDRSFREAVVARATLAVSPAANADAAGGTVKPPNDVEAAVNRARQLRTELEGTGFALGWPLPQCAPSRPGGACDGWDYGQIVLGWLITALAVSLGAPFWFDLLNKFMVVRSTVKPAEKSGQEASKDSWPPASSDETARFVPLMLMPSAPDASRTGAGKAGG